MHNKINNFLMELIRGDVAHKDRMALQFFVESRL